MSEETIKEQVEAAKTVAEAKKKSSAGPSGKAKRKTGRHFPFKVEDGRTFRQVETESENGSIRKIWVPFCSELNILALTRDENSEAWGRLLEVVDRDGKRHQWAMPLSLTAGSGEVLRAELLSLGLEIEHRRDAKNWLLEYLMSAEPDQRARCVSRIGWHGNTFVFPDETIGQVDGGEKVILQSTERPDHAFNVAGSLSDWKDNIAALALGNSRIILAISVAFAAPMLALTGDEGGGFHFRGASSSGKSTALIVAGSVWGGGGTRGYVRQWRATDNALESIASLSCDSPLCLDELSQVEAKAAGAAAYMLANGKGKARAGREGQARKVLEWRVLFLSNGEIALADKIKEGGGRIAAGMEVRVIDLRADAGANMGIFENIHGYASPADFSLAIKDAANQHYGSPARALIAEIAKDQHRFRKEIKEIRRLFLEGCLPDGADGQVGRVADRFALVAAAGEIASALGLTGWPAGTAREAAQCCFQDWLSERGGIGSSEVAEARRRIAEALQVHGTSRFQFWDRGASDRVMVTNRMGYRKSAGEDVWTHFFMSEPLKELFSGLDFRSIVSTLLGDGVIVPQNGKTNKVFRVPTMGGPVRLYQIDRDALARAMGESDA